MKHGSRVTAVGAQGAGFERRAENRGGRFCARRLEFAQGVHRLRTVVNPQFSVLGSQFSVLTCQFSIALAMLGKAETGQQYGQ
jgi:hypothetical protein